MKKNILGVLGLSAVMTLALTACPHKDDDKKDNKNNAEKLIATLLENSDAKFVSLPEAEDWSCTLRYDESVEQYFVYAYTKDENPAESNLEAVMKQALEDDFWTCLNGDDGYDYEEYGCVYCDSSEEDSSNIEVFFYTAEGKFNIYVYDVQQTYTGKEIDYDGGDLKWYSDLIGDPSQYRTTWVDLDSVNTLLGTSAETWANWTVPADGFVCFESEATDESNAAMTLYFKDGSNEKTLFNAFKAATGWTAIEYTSYDYNLEAEDIEDMYVEVTLFNAFDSKHEIAVQYYSFFGQAILMVNKFGDSFNDKVTTDTDWNDDTKAAFDELGFSVPFVALGDDYCITDEYYEDYGCFTIYDSCVVELINDYDVELIKDGFHLVTEAEDEDFAGCYSKEFGDVIIYVDYYYDTSYMSNTIDIYPMLNVNWGSEASPLSVTEAIGLSDEYLVEKGDVSDKPAYVTGTVKSIGETGNYYKNVVVTDGTSDLLVYTLNVDKDKVGDITLGVGDTVLLCGYIKNYNGTSVEMATANNQYAYIIGYTKKSVALNSITLNKTTANVAKGGSLQLEATLNPTDADANVTWSTNNQVLSSVDQNGLVTIQEAATAGTTIVITATDTISTKSASCTITVVEPVKATDFNIINEEIELEIGESVKIETEFVPEGSVGSLSYGITTASEGIIELETGGYVKGLAAGTGTVEMALVGSGTYKNVTVTVKEAAKTVIDTLTAADFKATTTSYVEFSGVKKNDAVYAGASAKDNSGNIQIRSKNASAGIVSVTSGGTIKKVSVTYGSTGGDLEIYASNTTFTYADMFNGTAGVVKVGEITGASTTYEFTTNYAYVGVRSKSGAAYIKSIDFVWAK